MPSFCVAELIFWGIFLFPWVLTLFNFGGK